MLVLASTCQLFSWHDINYSQELIVQDFYLPIKTAHMSLAMISLLGFIIRGWWAINSSALLQQRWVKNAPHIVDTLLLTTAVLLMIILGQHPGNQGWILAKLIALVFYIGFGTLAIKRAPTRATKILFFGLAIATFAYIIGVAIAHHPTSWLGVT
ncbi:MAG: regulator SirB [SAR86 cluster bacterium]|uniref:Regulator SirB n=1 Tax=SAR86 cluster bacterium TaxID=2030880 RepID=A0A2A4X4R9_9GAMM|nr:MAG: regulator SirB [SAR86 cluster bacterium]